MSENQSGEHPKSSSRDGGSSRLTHKRQDLRNLVGQAAEDYLKAIFEIAGTLGIASTNQIAEKLGVRPASVTGMLQKLANLENPPVEYHKHRGVVLTPSGEKIAVEIIRHHRLLELFLHNVLGYTWDEVHREAELLEHFISEKFEERIAAVLGNPEIDPHGDPIPTPELKFPEASHEIHNLHELRPPQRAVVQRVNSSDDNFLRHLASLHLMPGSLIDVVEYAALDDTLKIRIIAQPGGQDQRVVTLGRDITSQVHVFLI